MEKNQAVTAKRPLIYVKTFGCQMNVRDSEAIRGLLESEGYEFTNLAEEAGIVLLVTCSVRQHAEDKVWSEIGRYAKQVPVSRMAVVGLPIVRTKPIIGLIGCMAENYKEAAFKRAKGIDLIVGPNNIGEIPKLLENFFTERRASSAERRFLAVGKAKRDELVYAPEFRQDKSHAYVVISEGCNNFCSYCVVPFARGRLRNRDYCDILNEIKKVVAQGIDKVTLLGQNVNSYVSSGKAGNFIKLLAKVNKIEELKEISFVTSHPKDASANLFKAMARLEKVKKSLHLPFQSGSNRILRLMKRRYVRERYIKLTKSYRKIIPGGFLSTDIIVGYPTETEKDFQATLNLIKEVKFNIAYIFKYSPRAHTEAAELKDDVPEEEKSRRHKILLNTVRGISATLKKYDKN